LEEPPIAASIIDRRLVEREPNAVTSDDGVTASNIVGVR